MEPKFNIAIDEEGGAVITCIIDGALTTIDDSHPSFSRVMSALVDGENPTPFLSPEVAITRLDDRVSLIDEVLYFDGQPMHNNLTRTILRYTAEGRDTQGLVRFMERLDSNPSRRSREQLFDWVEATDLTIDDEGFIIGYKGLTERIHGTSIHPVEKYPWESLNAGTATVDGTEVVGQIPAGPGAVIEMPRDQVQDDPTVGCSIGLHVGNYGYARSFGSILVTVKFDPAHVVSVPTDSSFQKLRCHRYTIIDLHQEPVDDLGSFEPEADWDEGAVYDSYTGIIPESFLDRLKRRLRNRSSTSQ